MLTGKRILVTGVVTTDSIAWAVAERAQLYNAEVILTTFDRVRDLTVAAACALPRRPEILTLDATRREDYDRLRMDLADRPLDEDHIKHHCRRRPTDRWQRRIRSSISCRESRPAFIEQRATRHRQAQACRQGLNQLSPGECHEFWLSYCRTGAAVCQRRDCERNVSPARGVEEYCPVTGRK